MKKIILLCLVFIIAAFSFRIIKSNSPEQLLEETLSNKLTYMIDNINYKYRVTEITTPDFEFKMRDSDASRESTIDILPLKPRPVDFAWAAIKMQFSDKLKNMEDLGKNSYYTKVTLNKKTAFTKELDEDGIIREYILNTNDKGVTIKIYLNNPSTRDEFEPIIDRVITKLEFY